MLIEWALSVKQQFSAAHYVIPLEIERSPAVPTSARAALHTAPRASAPLRSNPLRARRVDPLQRDADVQRQGGLHGVVRLVAARERGSSIRICRGLFSIGSLRSSALDLGRDLIHRQMSEELDARICIITVA